MRAVFAENADPGFAVIDAIGGGFNWPNLRALLSVESTRDILFALLSPDEKQQDALKGNDAWVGEVKDLLKVNVDFIKKKYGSRFQENRLEEFVRKRFDISPDTTLKENVQGPKEQHFTIHYGATGYRSKTRFLV